MKRTVSVIALVLVALFMIGCLTACGGGLPAKGTYKLKEASGGAEMYNSAKDYITLEVSDGGSAKIVINMLGQTESQELTFKDGGKVDMDGSEGTYTVSGNTITIEDKDKTGKMVFEK